MAKFTITAPDGQKYVVEAPDDATEEEVLAYVQANYQQATAQSQAQPEQASMSTADALKRGAGLAARAVVSGLSTPVNIVGDAVSGVANLGLMAAGSPNRVPTMSQAQQQGLTDLGLPVPSGTAEKAATGAVSALAGAGPMNALMKAAGAGEAMLVNTPAAAAATGAAGATAPVAFETLKGLTGSDFAASVGSLGMSAVAAGLAGRAVSAGQAKPNPEVTMDQVKARASANYKAMEDSGITIKPISALGMVRNIRQALDDANFVPQDPTQAKVVATLNRFEEMIGTQRLPFTKLEQMRTMANDIKASNDPNIRRLGGVMVSEIDSYVSRLNGKDIMTNAGNLDDAVKAVREARRDWRNLSRATILEDALNIAEIKAAKPTASEAELIRDGFINIAKDKNKMRLFTTDEQNAIRAVTKGIPLDGVLSQLARFNPQRNQLILGGGGITSAATGSKELAIGTGLVSAGGFLADKAQQALRSRQARSLVSDILSDNVRPQAARQAFRGLLSGPQQLSDEDVEAIRSLSQ